MRSLGRVALRRRQDDLEGIGDTQRYELVQWLLRRESGESSACIHDETW